MTIICFIIRQIKIVITFRFTAKIGTDRFEKYVHKQIIYYSLRLIGRHPNYWYPVLFPFLKIFKSEWKYTISRVCEGKMGTPEVK